MTSPPKIRIRGLSKRFGRKVVLDGIDLDLASGESVVVIGGSGSGKSVLLKCILGILKPEAGTIEIDGENVLDMARRRREEINRQFGMLFQGGALFDSLPVWENVAFALLARHAVDRGHARGVAIGKLAQVGLTADVADLFPSELSGGMQKRVGLARAIAAEPKIIFFDEPTTGLDPIMADVINTLIIKTTGEVGASALSITHDMASARKIANRIAPEHLELAVADPAPLVDKIRNANGAAGEAGEDLPRLDRSTVLGGEFGDGALVGPEVGEVLAEGDGVYRKERPDDESRFARHPSHREMKTMVIHRAEAGEHQRAIRIPCGEFGVAQ